MRESLSHNEAGVPLPNREDAQMDDNGTKGWPVALERRAQQKIRLLQSAPSADFISQLIAERDQLPLANDNVGTAVGAYAAGRRIAVRRMPAGYRKSVVA
jgi:hypothetical protein